MLGLSLIKISCSNGTKQIEKEGTVTDIINRKYFYSAYFRDPGQIIYELATTGPGFTVDETFVDLGSTLMLPEDHESERASIEARH